MSESWLKKERKNDIYLYSTSVENMFINELLPIAPGEYVKVYLFGLMYAEQERPISAAAAAKALRMTREEIDNAWKYWEKWGAVRLEREDAESDDGNYRVVFLSQIEAFYGSKGPSRTRAVPAAAASREERTAAATEEENSILNQLYNKELKAIYAEVEARTGRMISRTEAEKICDAVLVSGVTPDVYTYAVRYCVEREKTAIEYITAVALRWSKRGCRTIPDVKKLIDAESERSELYRRVFEELGFRRASTPGDRAMIDKWADEWGFTVKDILDACRKTAGVREPSLRYVERVLENRLREYGGLRSASGPTGRNQAGGEGGLPPVSGTVLDNYYRFLRDQDEEELKRRLEEVVTAVPLMRKVLDLESELHRGLLLTDFSREAKARRETCREKLKELNKEKKEILSENGYPEDYLETPYKCKICRDTGVTDEGRYCSCRRERAGEAYIWNKSRLMQQQK